MSAPVFLAESARLEQYPAGSVYVLDGPEGRHAGVVQRRRAGEQIDVTHAPRLGAPLSAGRRGGAPPRRAM